MKTKREYINELKSKFSPAELSESIWLRTKQVTTLEQLSDKQLEDYYHLFFPKPKSIQEALQVTLQELQHTRSLQTLKEKRASVLAIATRVGIKEPDNWDKFNAFMLKSSVLKKNLYQYTISEMGPLIAQFKSMEGNFNRSSENMLTKAHRQKYNQQGFSEN